MATLPPANEDELTPIEGEDEIRVYRVVKSADAESAEFVDSLKSNQELGKPPRGQEIDFPLIHSGLSVWEMREQAAATAIRFPAMGGFVTELRLTAGTARYFRWGSRPGHLTIWSQPLTLCTLSVDTLPLDQCK